MELSSLCLTDPPGDSDELWNVLEQWFSSTEAQIFWKLNNVQEDPLPKQFHQISRSKWPWWFTWTAQMRANQDQGRRRDSPKLLEAASKKRPRLKSPNSLIQGLSSRKMTRWQPASRTDSWGILNPQGMFRHSFDQVSWCLQNALISEIFCDTSCLVAFAEGIHCVRSFLDTS